MNVTGSFAGSLLPRRPRQMHKGDCGKAFLLCGSVGYTGAARLAAESCLRTGAGLVCLGVPRAVYAILAASCPPEIMCVPLPDDAEGRLAPEALPAIRTRMDWCDAALIGPGLGRSEALCALVRTLCDSRDRPLVLDADGLNAVAGHILVQRQAPLILTPHDGEFARLFGEAPGTDRETAVRTLAARRQAIVTLKGHVTLTADPDGQVYVNTTGNPGMATGGSGDVLAGLLVGLAAQKAAAPVLWQGAGWSALTAAAVYWHGRAGDLCADEWGEYGMTPSDIIARLPHVLRHQD